ncbi:MAG: electron transfer flavoprotein subunit beta/FixA family protein [Thermoprotei archaeon]|jgi:electron transfer flavoprotein beta subunit
MKFGVLLKLSLDMSQIKLDEDGRPKIETPLRVSDIDKNALEEAIRFKEKIGGKVTVLSVLKWGPKNVREREVRELIKSILAIGADEAYVVDDERIYDADPSVTAFVLAEMVKKLGGFDVIFAGEGTIDGFSSQVPYRVAEILGIRSVGYARKIEVVDGNVFRVYCDYEDYIEVVEVNPPLLITVTQEINTPRLPTITQILAASRKPFVKWNLNDIGLFEIVNVTRVVGIKPLKVERKGIRIKGDTPQEIAKNLIQALLTEKVIG